MLRYIVISLIAFSISFVSCSNNSQQSFNIYKDDNILFKYDIKCIDWELWHKSKFKSISASLDKENIYLLKMLSSYDENCTLMVERNKFKDSFNVLNERFIQYSKKVNTEGASSFGFKYDKLVIEGVDNVGNKKIIKYTLSRKDDKHSVSFKFLSNGNEYSFGFIADAKYIDECKKWRDDVLSSIVIK